MNAKTDIRLKYITLTGLFAALITLFTAYVFHIPMGFNGGYIHLGDALIYLAAVLLRFQSAEDGGAVAFRAATGENDFIRLGAKEFRKIGAGGLDGRGGAFAERMRAGRIAVLVRQKRDHGLEYFTGHARGGVVVNVNDHFGFT